MATDYGNIAQGGAQALGSLYNLYSASQAGKTPGDIRKARTRLQQLEAGETDVTNTPVFKASQQAAMRKLSGMGLADSGIAAEDMTGLAANAYNTERNYLTERAYGDRAEAYDPAAVQERRDASVNAAVQGAAGAAAHFGEGFDPQTVGAGPEMPPGLMGSAYTDGTEDPADFDMSMGGKPGQQFSQEDTGLTGSPFAGLGQGPGRRKFGLQAMG